MKISAKKRKFSFTAESKELDSAISKITAVMTTQSSSVEGFLIVADDSKLYLIGFKSDTFASIVIKSGTPEGQGSFMFDQKTFQGLIKNRGEMKFEHEGQDIKYSSVKGKYNGSIHGEQFTDEQALVLNSFLGESQEQNIVIPSSVLAFLKDGVKTTAITDMFTSKSLLSYIVLNEKGVLLVSSFDKHHFGLYCGKTELLGTSFKVAMPSSHFTAIERLAESENIKFFMQQGNLKVEGQNFLMVLPSIQTDEKNFDLISGFIKALDPATFSCAVDSSKLSQVVDNMFSLNTKGQTSFDISHTASSKFLTIEFNTSVGSASDSIAISEVESTGIKARIDPRIFKDLISLVKFQKSATLSLVPQRVIKFECKTEFGKVVLVGALAG